MAYNKCIFSGAIKTKLKPKSARKTVYAQFPLDSASLGRQLQMDEDYAHFAEVYG